jgi:acyl-CoA thioester hydrolase
MSLSRFSKEFSVRLHETDLGGIVHHSNYFHWIEETEYAFFRTIGEPVIGELDVRGFGSGWPRGDMQVRFLQPLRFGDRVRVDLKVRKLRSAGIVYEVEIYRLGSQEALVLRGNYSAVCCLYDSSGRQNPKVVPIPESFLGKVSVACAT